MSILLLILTENLRVLVIGVNGLLIRIGLREGLRLRVL
jgi:hypothetical protein